MNELETDPQTEIETAPVDENNHAGTEAEGGETPAVAEPTPEAKAAEEAEKKKAAAQAAINKRIAQEVAKRHEAERKMRALEEMLAAKAGAAPEELPTDPAEVRRMIQERAAELAKSEAAKMTHAAAFNERCNQVATEGATIPTFKDSVANLQALGVMRPDSDFMQSVVAMKAAPAILDHLGQNPDLALEIAELTPHKLAARLADIASEVGKPKQISRAPAPAKPINVTASPSKPKNLAEARDDKEWLALRREQRKARFSR